MKVFTVTQKIISLTATYDVRNEGSDEIIKTIRGKMLTISPRLEMKEGKDKDGTPLAKLHGNYLKTKFKIFGRDKEEAASLKFPALSFLPTFRMTVNGITYKAKSKLLSNKMTVKDESGNEVFYITKNYTFRDKFTVAIDEQIPDDIGILCAVAIDQKYYQKKN